MEENKVYDEENYDVVETDYDSDYEQTSDSSPMIWLAAGAAAAAGVILVGGKVVKKAKGFISRKLDERKAKKEGFVDVEAEFIDYPEADTEDSEQEEPKRRKKA